MLVSWFRRLAAQLAPSRRARQIASRRTRLLVESLEMRVVPATITVTSTGDTIASDGFVTLREAITAANTNAASGDAPAGSGTDTINFNISGLPGTVHTIQPASALPTITEAVTINGYSQLGSSVNTASIGTNAFLAIELDGTNAGFTAGLTISAGGSTVRGLIINRFANEGILVFTGGGNTIAGNYLGTDATGKLDRGNGVSGVSALSATNTIGGTAAADRNIISGNDFAGITVTSAAATGNFIRGNLIGVNDTGVAALANTGAGMRILNVQGTQVGGTAAGAGNVIAFNTGAGIDVADNAGTGNSFLGNSIHSNGGLGIDAGASPNGLVNLPVLTAATNASFSSTIEGTLQGAANTTYRVELFANAAADPSGFGEGQVFLGFVNVLTDAAGAGTIEFSGTLQAVGSPISATATNPAGTTSAFSAVTNVLSATGSATIDQGSLIAVGTAANDLIFFETVLGSNQIRVRINGAIRGVFARSSFQRIVAHGLGGNDTIVVGATLAKPTELHGNAGDDRLQGGAAADRLFGEAGNDRLQGQGGRDLLEGGAGADFLQGNAGNDLLLGGAGDDSLLGQEGRDLLIGGLGVDYLSGGLDDDLLIGGTTIHDASAAALNGILNEWNRFTPRQTRITNLTSGGGLNGSTVLTPGVTVTADGAADRLLSGPGLDWIFQSLADGDLRIDTSASDRVESF